MYTLAHKIFECYLFVSQFALVSVAAFCDAHLHSSCQYCQPSDHSPSTSAFYGLWKTITTKWSTTIDEKERVAANYQMSELLLGLWRPPNLSSRSIILFATCHIFTKIT
jgi:hypothetical protein